MKFLRISRNIILALQFLTIATMFVGTILLVTIGKILEQGRNLKQEQDLTI